MPELPEVEIAARSLRRWCVGHTVTNVYVDPRATRMLRPHAPAAIRAALEGHTITAVDRVGKHLCLTLSKGAHARTGLWCHLGMTGKWVRRTTSDAPHARLAMAFALDAWVVLLDPRMFGRLRLVPDAAFDRVPELAALGPDPLRDGIDPVALHARLQRVHRPIKVALLDQALLAGIGNIQASEALFRARVDPTRRADALTVAEVRALVRGIEASLAFTLRAESKGEITYVEEKGAPNPFRVYDREGTRCPRCHAAVIARIVQAQRATFFCPRCQAVGPRG